MCVATGYGRRWGNCSMGSVFYGPMVAHRGPVFFWVVVFFLGKCVGRILGGGQLCFCSSRVLVD